MILFSADRSYPGGFCPPPLPPTVRGAGEVTRLWPARVWGPGVALAAASGSGGPDFPSRCQGAGACAGGCSCLPPTPPTLLPSGCPFGSPGVSGQRRGPSSPAGRGRGDGGLGRGWGVGEGRGGPCLSPSRPPHPAALSFLKHFCERPVGATQAWPEPCPSGGGWEFCCRASLPVPSVLPPPPRPVPCGTRFAPLLPWRREPRPGQRVRRGRRKSEGTRRPACSLLRFLL